jgi:hypothetical protein
MPTRTTAKPKAKKTKPKKVQEIKKTVWMLRDSVSGRCLKMGNGASAGSFSRNGTVFMNEPHLLKAIAFVNRSKTVYAGWGHESVKTENVQVIPFAFQPEWILPVAGYGE